MEKGVRPFSTGAASLLLMILLSCLLFSRTWGHPFYLDAVNKIELNPDLRDPHPTLALFFNVYPDGQKGTHFHNDPSRPLTYFFYWTCWQLGKGSPTWFHATNSVLHGATAGMLILFLSPWWGLSLSVLAGLLFLVLPLNAGTVMYAFGLSDILSAFLILSIFVWSQTTKNSRAQIAGAVVLFMAALATKQSAIVVPALVFLLRKRDRQLFATLSFAGLGYLMARFMIYGRVGDLEAVEQFDRADYFLFQGSMIFKYIEKALLPIGLALDHAVKIQDVSILWQMLSWLVIAVVSGVAAWRWTKSSSDSLGWPVAWFLFLIPLLPVSSFMPTTDLFVERRAYLSSVGLIGLLVPLVKWGTRPILQRVSVLVAVLVMGTLTWKRQEVYQSAIGVYGESAKLYPFDLRSKGNLATAHYKLGNIEEAQKEYEAILAINPKDLAALNNLASIYFSEKKELDKAAVLYRRAIEVEPRDLNANFNYGLLLANQGKMDSARRQFQTTVQLNDRFVPGYINLAKLDILSKNWREALEYLVQVLALAPDQSEAIALKRLVEKSIQP
ncbi:MAG: tetratricopeptide repeat protein [Bdellovibrionales bacterium]